MRRVFQILLWVCVVWVSGNVRAEEVALSDVETSTRLFIEINQIYTTTTLTTGEKIERLRGYFVYEDLMPMALWRIEQLDKAAAAESALGLFRADATSRLFKIALGRRIVQVYDDEAFVPEFGTFLVNAILNGGKEEFCGKREEETYTAVGEYAYMASGFKGYSKEIFAGIADARVVPVLIACLDAPDTVKFSDPFEETPTESVSTGRNVARQEIPVVLGRLKAVQAVDDLTRVMMNHQDQYLRRNAAYALGVLADRNTSDEIVKTLNNDNTSEPLLFYIGKGLIEKGDASGVPLMDFKYSMYYSQDNAWSVLQMVRERAAILRSFNAPEIESFYRSALEHSGFRDLLSFDTTRQIWMKRPRISPSMEEGKRAQIITVYRDITQGIVDNRLLSLMPVIEKVAHESENDEIIQISRRSIQSLQSRAGSDKKE